MNPMVVVKRRRERMKRRVDNDQKSEGKRGTSYEDLPSHSTINIKMLLHLHSLYSITVPTVSSIFLTCRLSFHFTLIKLWFSFLSLLPLFTNASHSSLIIRRDCKDSSKSNDLIEYIIAYSERSKIIGSKAVGVAVVQEH